MRRVGITLVEIVVVVMIVAILAAVAVPSLLDTTDEAAYSATITHVRAIQDAATMYRASTGQWPPTTSWVEAAPDLTLTHFGGFLEKYAFKSQPPLGASYMWINFGHDDIGVVILPSSATDYSKWEVLDERFDDGHVEEGDIQRWDRHPSLLLFPMVEQ